VLYFAPDLLGMVLRISRRGPYAHLVILVLTFWITTTQLTKAVGRTARWNPNPAFTQSIFNGCLNVLVRMFIHSPPTMLSWHGCWHLSTANAIHPFMPSPRCQKLSTASF